MLQLLPQNFNVHISMSFFFFFLNWGLELKVFQRWGSHWIFLFRRFSELIVVIASYNNFSWKKPSRSSSQTIT